MNENQLPASPDAAYLTHLLALSESVGWRLLKERCEELIEANRAALDTVPGCDLGHLQGQNIAMRAFLAMPEVMIEEERKRLRMEKERQNERRRQDYIEHSQTPYG